MQWLPLDFSERPAQDLLLTGNWNEGLVLLSVVVAIYASFIALQVTDQARGIRHQRRRQLTTLAASLALGGGIWAMHFIGMLAFHLDTAVDYNLRLTLLSILPGIVASWVALTLIGRKVIGGLQLGLGGILVGAGIGAMHYTGMAAMEMTPGLHYDLRIFVLSIVVAVLLAIVSLGIRFKLKEIARIDLAPLQTNLVSSTIMGLAISGMHYTGMAAARFSLPSHMMTTTGRALEPLTMALGISVMAIAVASLVLTINLLYKYKDASQLARKNASRLEATMATAIDPMISFDRKGRMLRANRAVTCVLGWDESQLRGRAVDTILPAVSIAGDRLCVRVPGETTVREVLDSDCETFANCQTGQRIPVRLAVGFSELDDESFFVAFISDLSQRVAMENELREAKDRAELAAQSREMFLANMSHEIRTPMNAVIGFSDLLLTDQDLADQQRRHMKTINSSARSLLHLLDDILDTAKLEQGKVELNIINFSLTEEVGQLISSLWVQADAKGLDLICNCARELADYYRGAPDKLRQILTNLIGNAIKFTEQGQVILTVKPTAGQRVYFEITDTGIGIAADRLASIFDPFNQADASVSRRFGGTGLGTSISKQLVELMGGELKVNSEPGVGSQFFFEIALPQGRKPEKQQHTENALLPSLTILVADDAPFNLDLMEAILRREGHQVFRANDGLDAVTLCREQQPDIILMDIQMPHLDGLDATREIRALEQQMTRPARPIIALTAGVFARDREAAREAGMDGFVNKPIDARTLHQEMARVIGLRQRQNRIRDKLARNLIRQSSSGVSATEPPTAKAEPPVLQ